MNVSDALSKFKLTEYGFKKKNLQELIAKFVTKEFLDWNKLYSIWPPRPLDPKNRRSKKKKTSVSFTDIGLRFGVKIADTD